MNVKYSDLKIKSSIVGIRQRLCLLELLCARRVA